MDECEDSIRRHDYVSVQSVYMRFVTIVWLAGIDAVAKKKGYHLVRSC